MHAALRVVVCRARCRILWQLGEAVSKKGGKKEAAFYEKVNRAHKAKDSSFGWPASFMPTFLGTKEGADGGVQIALENVLKGCVRALPQLPATRIPRLRLPHPHP